MTFEYKFDLTGSFTGIKLNLQLLQRKRGKYEKLTDLREDREQMSSQFKTSNDGVKRAINLIPSSVVISFSNFNFSCAHLSMASSIVWSLINRITVTSLNKIKYSVLQILVNSMN